MENPITFILLLICPAVCVYLAQRMKKNTAVAIICGFIFQVLAVAVYLFKFSDFRYNENKRLKDQVKS